MTVKTTPTRPTHACTACNLLFLDNRLFLNLQLMEYFCEDCVTPTHRQLTYAQHETVKELAYNQFVKEQWFDEAREYLIARDFLFLVVKAGKFSPTLYDRFVVWANVDKLAFANELRNELFDSLRNRLRDRTSGRGSDVYAEVRYLIAALRYVRPLSQQLQRAWEDDLVKRLQASYTR